MRRWTSFMIGACAVALAWAGASKIRTDGPAMPRTAPHADVGPDPATSVRALGDVASRVDDVHAHGAAAELGRTADPRAVPALRELLGSSSPPIVRANAARAIALSGSAADTAFLCDVLTRRDEVPRVRMETALALGKIADASAVGPLAALLRDEASREGRDAEQLRIAIVQALGMIGGAAAHTALDEHAHRTLSATERAFTRRALSAPRSGQYI